ncbi:MAG: hypothetical protein BAJALOKI1v1_2170009 [Promethearchaeota archaeon]|nr:MAG: hypothetical protein BAJALOKI1v1_2170009 [Candidatus Lokiarchaeota archaeon]
MCPIHHDIIDSDEETYTVAKLTQMKTEHEKKYQAGDKDSSDDDIADQFLGILKQTLLEAPKLMISFDKEHIESSLTLSLNNDTPQRITLIDIEMREKSMDPDMLTMLLENKPFIQQKLDDYNKKIEHYERNKEFVWYLLNKGDFTCNEIDLTINTKLPKEFLLQHETMIRKPLIPSLSEFSRKNIRRGHIREKIRQFPTKEVYPFESNNLIIERQELTDSCLWKIKYHIDHLRHNDSIALEPIQLFVPVNSAKSEIEFACSFLQRERGTVDPQKLKIIVE